MRYFPFDDHPYTIRMNVRVGVSALVEVDPVTYRSEVMLRRKIAASDPQYYVVSSPQWRKAEREVAELLLSQLSQEYPEYFALDTGADRCIWRNGLLDEEVSLPRKEIVKGLENPLEWIGGQVQEDLVLMGVGTDGSLTCVGGHLCFGSQWSLPEKIGMTFEEIHAPVPGLNSKIGPSGTALLKALGPGRPVERLNWTISSTDRLNLSPATRSEWEPTRRTVTAANAGITCFLRIERQTLSRLPRTGSVLFTIRTYLHSLEEVAQDPTRLRRMSKVLKSLDSETLHYKGISEFAEPLFAWLDRRAESCSG